MSWYVQQLILHRMEIKLRAEEPDTSIVFKSTDLRDTDLYANYYTGCDMHNDILLVEKAISELYKMRILTANELILIERFSWNPTLETVAKELGMTRYSISNIFVLLCNIISNYMKGIFTDKGYLLYMKEEYNLTDEQIETLKKYMKSKLKHKLTRRV